MASKDLQDPQPPGETKESIRNTIDFAKQLDCETIQVSVAHAFPRNRALRLRSTKRFITNDVMADTRWPTSSTPASPPSTSWRWSTASTTNTTSAPGRRPRRLEGHRQPRRPLLYTEAKSFMKLRAQRNKASRKAKEENALKQQESVSMNA